jgi:hypothetical protein
MGTLGKLVLVAASIFCISYNIPYLWYVEYRYTDRALQSPVAGPLSIRHLETTESTYESLCIQNIGHRLKDWEKSQGGVPVGELESTEGGVKCIVTWKPDTAMPSSQSRDPIAGLLYHPGYLEQRSIPELGQGFPVVILRVGTMEELKEFHSARNRFRILSSGILAVFAIGGILSIRKGEQRGRP